MNSAILRSDIVRALDELVSHEEAMKFQSLAVILGQQRWPELVAGERRWDLGRDAYVPARLAPDGKGKALAASITPTLAKLKADAAEISKHVDDVTLLIFVTPAPVSNHTIEGWAAEIRTGYGYELLVIPREEIISALLKPQNAPLCRSLLGIPVPVEPSIADLLERARRACQAEAAAWAAHPRMAGKPRIAMRAARLNDRGAETTEVVDVPTLRSLLTQGRRLILEAPAGRGKTTTLIELATLPYGTDAVESSFLVDFPTWVRSRQSILVFLANTRAFLTQRITATDLATLCQEVRCSFLLNGWNEVPERYSEDAVDALRDLERTFPGAGIVIATRTHHITPPLPGASRFKLLALTRAQRRTYLNAALEQGAGSLAEHFERDETVDELTRTPFILAEVVTLFRSGTPIPRTKAGVLSAVMTLMEAADEHCASLQGPPLGGRAREFLMSLALTMTARGAVTLDESDARSVVASVGITLRDTGQVAALPEPASVLGTLTAHHVLERAEHPSLSFRFEHQQFQEFFAAAQLRREIVRILPTDIAAQRRFVSDYLNWPIWEESVSMVAEELAVPGAAAPEALRVGRLLIEGAATVDLIFAATLARRSGETVWQAVRESVGARLRSSYRIDDPHYSRCALAAMLASGAPDFIDVLLPLLTHPDGDVRLRTYREGEFRISSLGADWRRTVDQWTEECRVDFVAHTPVDIAEDFALSDPSGAVRLAALDRLEWLGADASAACAVERSAPAAFEDILRRRRGFAIPASLHSRAREAYRDMLREVDEPVQRLNLLMEAAVVGDTEAIPAMQEALARLPLGPMAESAAQVVHAALTEIRRGDTEWANDWVAGRIIDGGPWKSEWMALVTSVAPTRRDDLLRAIASGRGSGAYAARDLVSQTADSDFAAQAFRLLCELRRAQATGQARPETAWNILDLLRHIPPRVAAAGIASCLSSTLAAGEHTAVVDIFEGSFATEGHLRDDLNSDDRQKLRAYLKGGIESVMQEDDFFGALKMNLAAALGRIGDAEDMPELWRLIQADLLRERSGRAARLAGERSSRAEGGVARCTNWYVGAVATLDPARADDILMSLLWEPEYEDDAAAGLVRLVVQERSATAGLSRKVNYEAVWKARAGADAEALEQERRARYASELKRRIAALRDERAASPTPDAYNGRLKQLAARIAALDGVASTTLVLELMALPGKFDEWVRITALEVLLVRGAHLPLDQVLPVVQPVIDHATGRARNDDQARGILKRCLCLLPFVDPPDGGIARVQELLASVPLHGYELAPLIRALGHSRCPGALAVLLEMATRAADSLSTFAVDWLDALVALGTTDSQRILLGAINPGRNPDIQALLGPAGQVPLAMSIAKIIRERPDEKERVLQLCDQRPRTAQRALLATVIAALGERDVVLRGLNLIRDDAEHRVPTGIWQAVQNAAIERRPLGANTYNLLPASAHDIRRRLLDMAMNDHERRQAAVALLGQIEEWRLDYGRPSGEPRHPDIDSGLPWPPMAIPE